MRKRKRKETNTGTENICIDVGLDFTVNEKIL